MVAPGAAPEAQMVNTQLHLSCHGGYTKGTWDPNCACARSQEVHKPVSLLWAPELLTTVLRLEILEDDSILGYQGQAYYYNI